MKKRRSFPNAPDGVAAVEPEVVEGLDAGARVLLVLEGHIGGAGRRQRLLARLGLEGRRDERAVDGDLCAVWLWVDVVGMSIRSR